MYKLISLLTIIFGFTNFSFSSTITFLVDYNIKQSNIEDFKAQFKFLFKKESVTFQRLGLDSKVQFSKKEKDFNFKSLNQTPSCRYNECRELKKYFSINSFDKVYYIRGENLCLKVNNNINLQQISKLKKSDLKKDVKILIIDMRGYKADPPPKVNLLTSSLKVSKSSVVNVISSIQFQEDSYQDGKMTWSINNEEIYDNNSSILNFVIKENSNVKFTWVSEDNSCEVDTNIIIESVSCDSKVPYSLNFDNKKVFGKDEENVKNANLHYVYPVHVELEDTLENNGDYYVLFLKQNCIFNEYQIEMKADSAHTKISKYNFLDMDTKFKLNQKELFLKKMQNYQFDEELIPILFHVDDEFKNIKTSLFIRPLDFEIFKEMLPVYEVFFTFCNPNAY